MAFSLYSATIPSYLQILPAIAGLIDKAEEYCTSNSLAPEALIEKTLADDMWPFGKQVAVCAAHSAGAVASLDEGVFHPPLNPHPTDFDGLRAIIADASATLKAVTPEQIDSKVGQDAAFAFGTRRMDFTAEDFLLSFALPNFYFHAATAYDILRAAGVPLGKGNFLGKVRVKV